jgi:cell division protein FtsL
MGTLAAIWKKSDSMAVVSNDFLESDPYALRALPNDNVFFYAKKMDNGRLVRQADPRAADECWSAVGAAALLLMLGVSVVVPHVALVRTGYKLEAAKAERQTLLNERRALEVREAALLSPSRLNDIAKEQNLTTPVSGQVFHLDGQLAPQQGNLASNQMPAVPGNR